MGQIYAFTGIGHGKTPAAIGEALMRAALGDQVVIIQFMKGKGLTDSEILNRLEPEFRIFHFEKSEGEFVDLPKEKQEEEIRNIKNGINFAKKVIATDECDLLVLDEILGLVDTGILSSAELRAMLESRPDDMDIILTGINLEREIGQFADYVSMILPG